MVLTLDAGSTLDVPHCTVLNCRSLKTEVVFQARYRMYVRTWPSMCMSFPLKSVLQVEQVRMGQEVVFAIKWALWC